MAVNELDKEYLNLLHQCDQIENIISGIKMDGEADEEKKKMVGNIIMYLEIEILDSKYTDAGKDMTRINNTITSGRTYWKS